MSITTERADTIARFLKEDAVKDALTQMEKEAYDGFLHAKTDDERRFAHAYAQAIARLETVFQAIVDAGERERMDAESADRRLATR